MSRLSLTLAAVAVGSMAFAGAAQARDQIRIVGSSTVFPYTQAVSEEYSSKTGNTAPVVESTGTGGGMKIFCGGVGVDHPDITGASRAMKESEYKLCVENGVTNITEALIGYDGLSIATARSGADLSFSQKEIFLALAAEVPVDGKWVANPYKMWNEINPDFPAVEIQVLGPPPTSGTRDAFVELAMEVGCHALPEHAALSKDDAKQKCARMRQDGPFIEAGENDNLIVQRLEADPNALGIFGYSFLYENLDKLKGVQINGVNPGFETIGDGSYPLSRPLFFYVKNDHRGVIPGLNEFLAEYVSDSAMGPGGYLHERGLVALSDDERAKLVKTVKEGGMMTRYGS